MQVRPPFMVSYSITQKCNLKCKHCYSESVDQADNDPETLMAPLCRTTPPNRSVAGLRSRQRSCDTGNPMLCRAFWT